MLVLSRKKNEGIEIGGDVKVIVVEIRGDKVRLGIEAPKEVSVHRSEVGEAIRRKAAKVDQIIAKLGVEEVEKLMEDVKAGRMTEAHATLASIDLSDTERSMFLQVAKEHA